MEFDPVPELSVPFHTLFVARLCLVMPVTASETRSALKVGSMVAPTASHTQHISQFTPRSSAARVHCRTGGISQTWPPALYAQSSDVPRTLRDRPF